MEFECGPYAGNMNIRSLSTAKTRHSQLQQERQVRSDIDKSLTRNARSLGRQTNHQSDLVEIGKRPPAVKAGVLPRRAPEGRLGSKDELLTGLSESVLNCFTGEEIGELMTEAAERSTESGQDMEPYFAALSFNKARRRIEELMPGASKKEIRAAAAADPKSELGRAVAVVDAASKYIRAVKREEAAIPDEKAAKMTAEQRETMNRVWETHQKMAADMRRSFEEIQKLVRDTNLEIHNMWLEGMKKRSSLQDKQFLMFLEIIQGPKE